MNFRFGFVAIFLILDVASVRSDDRSSKNSNKVQLSSSIANNPFLQSVNFPNVESNPFLLNNPNGNPYLPNKIPSKSNPFPNIDNNPFLNPTTPTTQSTTMQELPYSPTSLAPIIPESNTPSVYNFYFPTSHTHITPKINTTTPSISLSYEDLISRKINPAPTTISKRKCGQYTEEIAGTGSIGSLSASSSVVKVTHGCGGANRLVFGGNDTQDGEFPHMVALGQPNSNEFTSTCGGTLISHTWVLSAAHCTFGNNIPTHAMIGVRKLDQKTGITIAIKNMKVHEEYKPPAMYADIALVQLMDAVTFSTFIRPACLYQQYATVPKNAVATGWGITEYAGDQSKQLLKVQLDMVDHLFCTVRHGSPQEAPDGIRTSMVCAGYRNGTGDTCDGDSGGPLQINPDECLFQVIGITSFGPACGTRTDIPAIYTRVSYYVPWIEKMSGRKNDNRNLCNFYERKVYSLQLLSIKRIIDGCK